MKWDPKFIDQLAVIATNRLEAHYENNWKQHYEVYDGHLIADLRVESTFHDTMAEIANDHEIEDSEGLAETVWPFIPQAVFESAEEYILDAVNDAVEYQKNPLTYHGLSYRDFL